MQPSHFQIAKLNIICEARVYVSASLESFLAINDVCSRTHGFIFQSVISFCTSVTLPCVLIWS